MSGRFLIIWFEVLKRGIQVGQSSSQRKAQHQDVALWELYEEDGRSGERVRRRQEDDRSGRGGRNRNADRVNRGRQSNHSDRDRRVREPGREAERSGGAGRDGLDVVDVVNVRRDTVSRNGGSRSSGRGRTDSIGSDRRRTGSAGSSRGRTVNVYGQERETRRVDRSRSAGARQGGRGRQAESMARAGSAGRTGSASQIRYIQPYGGSAQRTGNYGYAYTGSARPVQSIRRRRARRRKEFLGRAGVVLLMVFCLMMIYFITGQIYQMVHREKQDETDASLPVVAEKSFQEDSGIRPPDIMEDLLEINEYSRPGTPLNKINSIFVHYTANPGTSAAQNRSYFSNLAQTHERSASAHLIIGYDGEVIQCIPFDEQAYAVMTRNEDSISIECCYLSEDGSFTQETYDTLIHTLAWLLEKYDLSAEDILRHYDCGGKLCPLYYAENEGAWEELRRDVAAYMAAAE